MSRFGARVRFNNRVFDTLVRIGIVVVLCGPTRATPQTPPTLSLQRATRTDLAARVATLEGQLTAVTTKGEPVVLRTDQPTFVDTDAVVAWSAGLTTSLRRSVKMKALIGKGSGEAVQLAFQGNGIIIVQPSEGDGPPTAQS